MPAFTIQIDAPPEAVFDELSHVERHPSWANPKSEMTMAQTSGDGPGPTATYRSTGVFTGKAVSADISVTKFDRPREFCDPLGPASGGQEGRLVRERLHPAAQRRRDDPVQARHGEHQPRRLRPRLPGDPQGRHDLAPEPEEGRRGEGRDGRYRLRHDRRARADRPREPRPLRRSHPVRVVRPAPSRSSRRLASRAATEPRVLGHHAPR